MSSHLKQLIKTTLFFVAFISSIGFVRAQNLLPNPSFEIVNRCIEHGSACAPKGWFNTNLSGVNSYIFLERAPTIFGNKCAQIKLYDVYRPQKRQYIFAPLLCDLKANEKYKFSVWVKAEFIAVSELHVLISDTMFIGFEDKTITENPSIILKWRKPFIYDKKGRWIKLTGNYTAQGGEKYLTFGYLTPDNEINSKVIRQAGLFAHIMIDSISLIPLHYKPDCNLKEATRKYYSERRRHNFDTIYDVYSYNMFPFLLKNTDEQEKAVEEQKETPVAKLWRNLVFDVGKADLLSQSYPIIDSLIEDLQENTNWRVTIIGHTDNSGSTELNQQLSQQRAKYVANYMMGKGIESFRLIWRGAGDTQPIADNTTETGRAMNRRVEFEFYTVE